MPSTVFFRLLKTPIDDKGPTLAARIAALNASSQPEETYALDPAAFAQIPGSPFAYWVGSSIHSLFVTLPSVESEGRAVRVGDHPGDHERYVRLAWEVPLSDRSQLRKWLPYQKGGAYSPYYADIHLVTDWDLERETYYAFHGRPGRSSEHPSNYQYFLRPGVTWPRRTQKGLNLRAMPSGCIFADKGPAVFVADNSIDELSALLALTNSLPFQALVRLQMAFGSYEIGVIQRTPVPVSPDAPRATLASLAIEAHDLQRQRDTTDETTHVFCLPALVRKRNGSLRQAWQEIEAQAQARQARLAAIQAEIDRITFDLYGMSEADRALVRAEMGQGEAALQEADAGEDTDGDEEESAASVTDLTTQVQQLLMWCVGVAFGRWDVRMVLDPTLLPALQGPFDPLPRCAPGALVGPDGLPAQENSIASEAWLRARPNVITPPPTYDGKATIPDSQYPIAIPWDGMLVDDPTHESDIVSRVRQVLSLLWRERADPIEQEACTILGVKSLRDYLRDGRQGFFAFHIKRYSKSRRKAPIYWLLQSPKRNYSIWLYCHHLQPDYLFAAARNYGDAKVKLEAGQLDDLRAALSLLTGSARHRADKEVERQEKVVADVKAFVKKLDEVALKMIPPDLNDGVTLSIAPLWELTPWKEAQLAWEALMKGEYGWSTMAKQMKARKLVNA